MKELKFDFVIGDSVAQDYMSDMTDEEICEKYNPILKKSVTLEEVAVLRKECAGHIG